MGILMRHSKAQGANDEPYEAQTEAQAEVMEQSGWKRLPAKEQPKEEEE
jgi:hypothetical protein